MTTPSANIILCTLNARYIHSAFGLRYLYANLGELQSQTILKEFTIHERPIDVVEKLLESNPKIIGFSVYIWNVTEIGETVAILKQVAPEVSIVLGGPEVSHLPDKPECVDLADYIIKGPGEISFRVLCEQVLNGQRPLNKVIEGVAETLDKIASPYEFYSDEDISNRLIYVEASRGCPFKCEFCLSSLDKTSKPFELGAFLEEMDKLYQRGARNFKFIDRTFNLKVSTSVAILEFFLERMTDNLYLHFEVIPDNLPEKLKQALMHFPKDSLQFEIGVQTFDPEIQGLISRKQDNNKTKENLLWLREHTGAHIHADLIFGLPSDTLDNFGKSFDQLVALNPQEIQLGILKRLRGAPLNRHNEDYQLVYSDTPPYTILTTKDISFTEMQRVKRFARYWDMIANSGRFKHTLPLILGIEDPNENTSAFKRFMQLSDALHNTEGSTWKIALPRLYKLLYEVVSDQLAIPEEQMREYLEKDHQRTKQKGSLELILNARKNNKQGKANKRQMNHAS
ncbi:DUF4080 domain-containing protein [Cocleimonas sp. KMM 6892]|uniref:B12-binding domain-containing radical SAM protein n=1 Tax=unclassified Cocleimonas TaxID=2639732 RepID=UPI002DB72379|nr:MULTISPECIES: DUF4080 domain-containing protein [unclassified Cocleimonas]MEB8433591.1 DUF4080 domain-containing protein [Cocleimonas sp. KMM 6892]MEC4716402.1 DUF4080 domain-containing protein [Cocleimonas sp. KMM 6895]MEC4745705.1 DUF4080 domain-containing protein [Cocleimonas sp. KMM 6896]